MAKPLRSQLNQVRAWVRQGRTDAWIAHQLEVSASELNEFRRRHGLSAEADEGDEAGEVDLRDEIEAEIAATSEEEELESAEEAAAEEAAADELEEPEPQAQPRRRRRRRRGRGGGRVGAGLQATFDHGDADGYGLWLDPAVADDPIYAEHWAGHRRIEVTVEPDRIVIKRSE